MLLLVEKGVGSGVYIAEFSMGTLDRCVWPYDPTHSWRYPPIGSVGTGALGNQTVPIMSRRERLLGLPIFRTAYKV